MLPDSGLPVPPALPRPPARVWLVHTAAFLLTLISTTYVGAWHFAEFAAGDGGAGPVDTLSFWSHGFWFSLPVLAILGVHEAAHYLACRWYRVDASLPLFLPAPLPLTGTLGAVIRIRDVIPHTRALFDIGASGPLAGFAVAVPALVAGLAMSQPAPLPDEGIFLALGEPPCFRLMQWMVWGVLPPGQELQLHPTALAAWFGLLATALNLFPLAQLDGGHIAHAVFGPRSRWITIGSALAILGLTVVSSSWVAWAVLVAGLLWWAGIAHPPTLDDAVPLGRARTALALVAALVFVACFTPAPVEAIDVLVRQGPVAPR